MYLRWLYPNGDAYAFFFKIISDTNISLNRILSKCFGSNFDKNPRVIDHVTQKSCGVICMTHRNDSYTYCASILHLNLQWLFINSSSEKTSENNTEILRFFFVWHFARSHFGYLLDSEDRRWIYQSASSKIKVLSRWSNSEGLLRILQFPSTKLETFKLESSRWIWKEWSWNVRAEVGTF